jgi:hypothetical protein
MRAKYAIFGMVVSFALGATALEGLRAQTKAPALGIVEVLVSDKEAYAKEFLPPITKTVSGSGGKFLAVGGKTVPLTGVFRWAALRFPGQERRGCGRCAC